MILEAATPIRVVNLTSCNDVDMAKVCEPASPFTLFLIGNSSPQDDAPVSTWTAADVVDNLARLPSDLYIAFIEPNLVKLFVASYQPLIRELEASRSAFTLLIESKVAPSHMRRYDGTVQSFLCKGICWPDISARIGHDALLEGCCFALLSGIMSQSVSADSLLIRQLPLVDTPALNYATAAGPSVAVIIPHRHPFAYLDATLTYVSRMSWSGVIRSAIGLDVEDAGPYLELKQRPRVSLYGCTSTAAVGPYLFRQKMIEHAMEELVLLQDSDDLPCSDRITTLYSTLVHAEADMVGSHELEVNEMDKKVRAYRFPLDVSSVLNKVETQGVSDNAAEPFLHATAIMNRRAFLDAGGFSTNRRIANDSQFLLRASFSCTIANANAFLYIRRVHRAALTVAPETHNGNELRKVLSSTWGTDFKRVKRGDLELGQSSLAAVRMNPEPAVELLNER